MLVVADGGARDGLGHISRASGLAIALRAEGLDVDCLAHRAQSPIGRDGIRWRPFSARPGVRRVRPAGLLIDSYHLDRAAIAELAQGAPVAVLHDRGEVASVADLVVSAAGDPAQADMRRLHGPRFACLRPMFWDLPPRSPREQVASVLVTTGAGDPGGVAVELAAAARETVPRARVTLVRGPQAADDHVPDGVETLTAPDSLLEPLLDCDVVVTAAGQTMLEALAAGTPTIAVALVDNQRPQAERLTGLGAVRLTRPRWDEVAATLAEVCADAGARRDLSIRGREVVDGQGARRVARRIAELVREHSVA